MRRGRLTGRQVGQVWAAYEGVPIRLVDVSVAHALKLAEKFRLYAYDAYFLQVARESEALLVTLDRLLRAAAHQAGVEFMEIRS